MFWDWVLGFGSPLMLNPSHPPNVKYSPLWYIIIWGGGVYVILAGGDYWGFEKEWGSLKGLDKGWIGVI